MFLILFLILSFVLTVSRNHSSSPFLIVSQNHFQKSLPKIASRNCFSSFLIEEFKKLLLLLIALRVRLRFSSSNKSIFKGSIEILFIKEINFQVRICVSSLPLFVFLIRRFDLSNWFIVSICRFDSSF